MYGSQSCVCPIHNSEESNRSLTPILLKKYRDTHPIPIAILLQKYAPLLAESSIHTTNLYHDTPPICIDDTLQKYLCQGSLEHSQTKKCNPLPSKHMPTFLSKTHKNSRGWTVDFEKTTPHGRWGQGPDSVDPMFPAGLPFPVPEILEFVAFRDSGKISSNFPGTFPEFSSGSPEQTLKSATAFSSFFLQNSKTESYTKIQNKNHPYPYFYGALFRQLSLESKNRSSKVGSALPPPPPRILGNLWGSAGGF